MSDVLAGLVDRWRLSDRHGVVHVGTRATDPPCTVWCGYGGRHLAEEPGRLAAPGESWPDPDAPVCTDCLRAAAVTMDELAGAQPAAAGPTHWWLEVFDADGRPVCVERRVSRLRRVARAVVDGLADWIDRDPGRRADEGKP